MLRNALRFSLVPTAAIALLLLLWSFGGYDMGHHVARVLRYMPGIDRTLAALLVLDGTALGWWIIVRISFFEDGAFRTELGVLLHLLYAICGISASLLVGLEAVVPSFIFYWPFLFLVSRILEPLLLRIGQDG